MSVIKLSYPLPDDEAERLAALRAFEVLDTVPEEAFDRITRLASRFTDAPIALVSLVDEARQWFKSRHGLDAEETPRELAFCTHAIMENQVMVVPDATSDERFRNNPLVTGPPDIRFYAGAPLTTSDGYNVGTLCVIDREARELTSNQISMLSDLAGLVVEQLEIRQIGQRLQRSLEKEQATEGKLVAREISYRDLVEASLQGIIIHRDDNIVFANGVAADLFGFTDANELIRMRKFDELIAPQDRPWMRDYRARRLRGEDVPSVYEFRGLRQDGGQIDLLRAARKIEWDGGPALLATLIDISEQKQAQAELIESRSQLAQLHEITSVHDTPFAQKIAAVLQLGIDSLGVEMGIVSRIEGDHYTVRYVVGPDWAPEPDTVLAFAETYCAHVFQQDGPVSFHHAGASRIASHPCYRNFGLETYIGTPLDVDGVRYGTLNFTASSKRDAAFRDHEVSLVRLLAQWISNEISRQRALETLRLLKDEAERANNAKSEFLSSMSHELRTPMNAILGFGQLMELDSARPLDKRQQEQLGHILDSGRHLLQLIDEILDLSKIEAGTLNLKSEPVALDELMDDCLAMMAEIATARDVSIENHLAADARPIFMADRVRLKQVVLNLLSNAVKYNQPGGHVLISWDEDTHRLEVANTGGRIPEENWETVFEPFTRLAANDTATSGTGIGLTISRRLINAMGGDIGLRARDDHLTSFWITLPLGAASPDHAEPGSGGPHPDDGADNDRRLAGWRVLYVEDNPSNASLMEAVLARIGINNVTIAHDAELGVDFALAEHPDLIIMDIDLPGLDGFEAMQILRDDDATADIPVIALSANAMQADVERGRRAGFVDYLTKPLDIPLFYDLLDTL